jgi:transposase
VAKQSRNNSQQKPTVGLDLGDRNSWYCVVDGAGQIQLEQRVRTYAKGLQEVFGAMPRSRIALEIGTHSPWVSRLLRELGHEVIVANARKVRSSSNPFWKRKPQPFWNSLPDCAELCQ